MMERSREIPALLLDQVIRTEQMAFAFLAALNFVVRDTGRDPRYLDTHMLSYAAQDYIQSAIALPMLVREGIHNVCRRELRFILEMSIKICRIQQQDYSADIPTKLKTLGATFDTTNISMQKQLSLMLLPEPERLLFYQEVGRLYGEMSGYVHWTSAQIIERIALVDQGRTAGFESREDVDALTALLARGLAASLVFIFHSVPEYVAGDFLVESDGGSVNWPFSGSRFIAHMDEYFDYKHERQGRLEVIRRSRWTAVKY
jgi:hypothetical protein